MLDFKVGRQYKFTRVDLGEDVWRRVTCMEPPSGGAVSVRFEEMSFGWLNSTLSQRNVGEVCSCLFFDRMEFGIPFHNNGAIIRWDELPVVAPIIDPTFGVFE